MISSGSEVMRKTLPLFFLILYFIPTAGMGQSTLPTAAVAPIAAIGEISSAQQQIIHTSLEALLSSDYKLISQEEYRRAEEIAFEQLDFDQCTEDQCVRLIQEVLQVERLFILQIIRDEDFTQLSLTLFRGGERIVRAETCEGCGTAQLNAKLGVLYAGIAGQPPPPPAAPEGTLRIAGWTPQHRLTIDGRSATPDRDGRLQLEPGEHRVVISRQGYRAKSTRTLIADGKTTRLSADLERIEPEPIVIEPPDDGLTAWRWQWGSALTVGLLAAAYGISEAQATEDANARQEEIIAEMEIAASQDEFDRLDGELQKEADAADTHQSNSDTGAILSVLLLGTALWIYNDSPRSSTAVLTTVPYLYAHNGAWRVGVALRW
ncbi:MAG: hypothetical protein IID61_06815 [SAR324 cluster bacterium]|nr:hypothetical protein [SAR324 cluster bacterium]